jgi:hypothetical protein
VLQGFSFVSPSIAEGDTTPLPPKRKAASATHESGELAYLISDATYIHLLPHTCTTISNMPGCFQHYNLSGIRAKPRYFVHTVNFHNVRLNILFRKLWMKYLALSSNSKCSSYLPARPTLYSHFSKLYSSNTGSE